MKGLDHVRRYLLRFVGRGAFLVGCVWLGLVPSLSHAAVVEGTITGFTPNPLPATGGAYVRTGSWQWNLARAVANYEASYAGRAVVGEAVITASSTAGRSMALACFSSPLAGAACTGAAVAAWMAYSRIHWDDDEWRIDEDQYGACYTTHGPINNGAFLPCSTSPEGAVASWVNTANANDYGDQHFDDSDVEVTWSTFSVPGPFSVNGNQPSQVTKQSVKTYHAPNVPPLLTSATQTVTVYRLLDQMSTTTRDATEGDMAKHGASNPPPDDVYNNWDHPTGVPSESPDFHPSVVPTGPKYSPDSTPNEGPWAQDRVKFTGRPGTADPMDLDVTTETVPVDNPNTDTVEGPDDGTDPDTDPKPDQEPFDLCKEHPDISACQPLGEAPDDQVPTNTADLQFQEETVGLPEACPAPIPMGSYGQLTFDSACTVSVQMRPFVVALGALSALLIMVAALRSS